MLQKHCDFRLEKHKLKCASEVKKMKNRRKQNFEGEADNMQLDKATRIVNVLSSFIESFPQISAKPVAFQQNLPRKLSRNRPFFTNCFSAKLASKIPAKFPRNRPFFPRICLWKSREIWLFFPQPTRSPVVWTGPKSFSLNFEIIWMKYCFVFVS